MDQQPASPNQTVNEKLRQSDIFRDFIRVALPILLLLAFTFSAIHYFHYKVTHNIMKVRESSHIRIGHEAIRNDVQAATTDLLHLAESRHMKQLLAIGSTEAKAHLAEEFHSILKAKKNYDQIRYLDETGMEKVRVNYNSGMPLTVPEKKLQNKGKRYYFTDTFKLTAHTVFVSPMDLNVENGQIEQPLKPMLRFGTPVFDNQGRKRGVLLINYFARTILNNLANFLDSHDSQTMLLNANGYWLMAPDPKDQWGFMFKNQRRFDRRYPKAWEKIAKEKVGQAHTIHGLFTFVTIYPLQQVHISSSGAVDVFAESTATLDDKAYYWVLATHIPKARLNVHVDDHIKQAALQCTLVSLIVLPLAWLFSRERIIRQWARRQLRRNENYLRTITSQLGEGLLVTDREGQLLTMNKEAERLLGWQSQELVGANLHKVLSKFPLCAKDGADDCVVVEAITEGVPQRKDHVEFNTRQGGTIPVSFSVSPFLYEDKIQGAIITFQDISERLQFQAELKVLATHDPLTGVKNRGEIERKLNSEVDRAKRYQRPMAVLLADIDHFKSINDRYGHQSGDLVLQRACSKMEQDLRNHDVLGRYGGEEFIVVLPEIDLMSATVVAERLRENLAALSVTSDQHESIRFTVSIGVAAYPASAVSAEKLVQVADEMLYKAKESGRNQVMAEQTPPPNLSVM